MLKKLSFKHKIDLLLISIEALDIYASEQLENNLLNSIMIYHKEKFLIRSGNFIRNPDNNSLCNFIHSITFLYNINNLINYDFLKKTAISILNNYNSRIEPKLTKKYINKFIYIHNRTQSYYNVYSYYKNLDLIEIAIINLYIISQITQKTGLYLLIKFLCLKI
uniref:Uncharacterized protein n=1 Tax=Inkyuleea mariana TaxID=123988 RepID=A0A4D6X365_9FLOR|nr:hypothetical protein [Inkyuleea mariana]